MDGYKIRLKKTVIREPGGRKVFYVDLPYDPSSAENADYYHQVFYAILDANRFCDYALDDARDGLIIAIHWTPSSNRMTIDYEDRQQP